MKKGEAKLSKTVKVVVMGSAFLIILYQLFPAKTVEVINISGDYGLEMLAILPAVLFLMALVDVWVPPEYIKKYLGKNTGIKGIILAVILGTLPTGPMYVAFPIAAELLKKGAGLKNIIIFLGVWASLKIPQIGIEIQFLGLKFAFLRFIFTLVSVVFIGIIIDYLLKNKARGGEKYVWGEESQQG
ncbi:MAG TPA: permease [Halanaerobiales bacterium]|nr:permease [Halanaerobiales bacterium]